MFGTTTVRSRSPIHQIVAKWVTAANSVKTETSLEPKMVWCEFLMKAFIEDSEVCVHMTLWGREFRGYL